MVECLPGMQSPGLHPQHHTNPELRRMPWNHNITGAEVEGSELQDHSLPKIEVQDSCVQI